MTETHYDQERMLETRKRLSTDTKTVRDFIMCEDWFEDFNEDDEQHQADAAECLFNLASTITWAQLICDFAEKIPELQEDIDYARCLLTKPLCERWLFPHMTTWGSINMPWKIPDLDYTWEWTNSWTDCMIEISSQAFAIEYLSSLGFDMSTHDSERKEFESKLFARAAHCPWSKAEFDEHWIGMYHISMIEERPNLNIFVRFLEAMPVRFIDKQCPVWRLLNE